MKGLYCQDCDMVFNLDDVDLDSPLYECNSCGTLFTRDGSFDGCSHRCPNCGKFGSKLGPTACPECEGQVLEEVEVEENSDGILVVVPPSDEATHDDYGPVPGWSKNGSASD